MEGVAGIGIARQFCNGFDAPLRRRGFAFQNQESGPFAEIQAGARFVKGPAKFAVQDHQGVESVQVEVRQAFAAARGDDFRFPRVNEFRAQDQGIGGR